MFLSVVFVLFALLVAFLIVMALIPLDLSGLIDSPNPTASYAEALSRFDQFVASRTDDELNPVCENELLTHGGKTEHVVVLIHGFTNCPAQFSQLKVDFFDAGYNVLIPLVPHHGLADRMTEDLANLTAEEMRDYADTVVDIAQGLGDHVTVVGISAGGAITGWIAQHRSDVDFAVLLAPGFGVNPISSDFQPATINTLLTLPNQFVWWDIVEQENKPGPPQIYPRYSTHAVAQLMRLGLAIKEAAEGTSPAAQSILVVTNDNDVLVNNGLTDEIVDLWDNARPGAIQTYVFDADLDVPHDMIEPLQEDQQVDIVYPILLDLILQTD